MSPIPERRHHFLDEIGSVGNVSCLTGRDAFQQQYLDSMCLTPLANLGRQTVTALEFTSLGALGGGMIGAGYGVGGMRLLSLADSFIKPCMGSFAYIKSPPINYAAVGRYFGYRGALAGAAVGLLAYGAYEAYEHLKK